MGIKARIGLCIVLFTLACSAVQAAGVKATLDRDHVTLGDTVTLSLHFPGVSDADTPDLSPLHKDFAVAGQSSSSSQSWINGQVSRSFTLRISLRPLHEGTLRIPPLDAGGQRTQALTLHVSAPSGKALGKAGDPAFVEVKLNAHDPYVGEQVALDLRLFYSAALTNGNLPDPVVDGATVRRLGREQRYQTLRSGERYFVVERHYAVIPKHAGTLRIPPVVFRGQALAQGGMGDFFGNVRQVGAQSAEQTLTVKPRPSASGTGAWLPARQLELNLSGLPASGKLQVGEPVTVTLQEGATGLAAGDLPEPTLPPIPGTDIYPDQPQDVTRNNGQWITGSRTRSFAIVPDKAGTLRIPAITLRWWNVVSDRQETARIPAHALTVVASAASAATPAAPATAASSANTVATPAPISARPDSSPRTADTNQGKGGTMLAAPRHGPGAWRWIALASAGLWLLTVLGAAILWIVIRRRRARLEGLQASVQRGHARNLRNAFLAACRSGDLRRTAHALLDWARSERPEVRHLQDLATRLQDANQRGAIERLEHALFAPEAAEPVDGDAMARAFRSGLAWREADERGEEQGLPPLYPPH